MPSIRDHETSFTQNACYQSSSPWRPQILQSGHCDKNAATKREKLYNQGTTRIDIFLHGSGNSCHMAIHVHALNYPFFGLCRVSAGPGSWRPVALPSSPWRGFFFDDSINAQKFTKLREKNARSSQEM